MLQLTKKALRKIVDSAIANISGGNFSGLLNGSYLHLLKAAPPFSPNLVFANLTPADYGGYAPAALTWNAPYTAQDGRESVTANDVILRPSNGTTPNNIVAVAVTDDVAGTNLLMIEYLPAVVEMKDAESEFTYVPTFGPPNAQGWGHGQVIA